MPGVLQRFHIITEVMFVTFHVTLVLVGSPKFSLFFPNFLIKLQTLFSTTSLNYLRTHSQRWQTACIPIKTTARLAGCLAAGSEVINK